MVKNKDKKSPAKTGSPRAKADAKLDASSSEPKAKAASESKPRRKGAATGANGEAKGPDSAIPENAASMVGTVKTVTGVDLTEKIKELVRLAQEQGYLTYGDVNDALPDSVVSPEDLDEIYVKLRNLEIEIVDQAEVDRVKQPEPEEEEDKSRLDILDDPVRMYLKQMGQVPLLTREQEGDPPQPRALTRRTTPRRHGRRPRLMTPVTTKTCTELSPGTSRGRQRREK